MLIDLPKNLPPPDRKIKEENIGYRWYDENLNRSELGFNYDFIAVCYYDRPDSKIIPPIDDGFETKGNVIFGAMFKHSKGIYESGLNPHLYLYDFFGRENIIEYADDLIDRDLIKNNFKEACSKLSKIPSFYGVADNITQILKHRKTYNFFIKSNYKFILTYSKITKKNNPDWRWHKWGPYIGTQKPKHEHIGDEINIEQVLVYHFYGIKNTDEQESTNAEVNE